MKIGLVAFQYHSGVLQMYLALCAAARHDVVLFTSEPVWRDVRQYYGDQAVPAGRIVLNTGVDDEAFIHRIAEESGDLDVILFVEMQSQKRLVWSGFLGEDFRCPVYCGVHDTVREMSLGWEPCWPFGDRGLARLRREAFSRIWGYVVHSPEIRGDLAPRVAPKKVCYLPAYFIDPLFRRNGARRTGPLNVCIIGLYTRARRDYALAFRALQRVLEMGGEAKLTLAGSPAWHDGQQIIRCAESLNAKHPGAVTWSGRYLHENEFRAALEHADVVLAPVIPPPSRFRLRLGRAPEKKRYALDTHITASTYDAIRFQMPVIYPSVYLGRHAPHPGAMVYREPADLVQLLYRLSRDRDLLAKHTEDMMQYAPSFAPQHFTSALGELLGG
ncbi:MAG: hypothetical protein V1873_04810 [Verrucomicrobiota bacterium]